VGLN